MDPSAPSQLALVGIAFVAGTLHGLEADHVLAVSGLAARRASLRESLRFCAHWAGGHGLCVMAVGFAVWIVGASIPTGLAMWAERAAGLSLVAIGVFVFVALHRERAHLHFHEHGGDPPHAHWHRHEAATAKAAQRSHDHDHTSVLVGMLHGLAGSAPLLVLIPLAGVSDARVALGYLASFSVGVLIAMLAVGGLLGLVFRVAAGAGRSIVNGARALIAALSLGYGCVLLFELG